VPVLHPLMLFHHFPWMVQFTRAPEKVVLKDRLALYGRVSARSASTKMRTNDLRPTRYVPGMLW